MGGKEGQRERLRGEDTPCLQQGPGGQTLPDTQQLVSNTGHSDSSKTLATIHWRSGGDKQGHRTGSPRPWSITEQRAGPEGGQAQLSTLSACASATQVNSISSSCLDVVDRGPADQGPCLLGWPVSRRQR